MSPPDARDRDDAPSVLILIGSLGYGGAENQVSLLAAALPAEGIRLRVACFGLEESRRAEMEAAGVPVDLLPVGGRGWWPLRVLPRIAGLVRRHRIGIVQAFLPTFDILAPFLRVYAPRLRIATSRRTMDDRLPPRQLRLFRLTGGLVHAVVANSEAVAASVRRFESVRPERLRVIPNGMPLPPPIDDAERTAARHALGFDHDALVVLYLAHFRNGKGHYRLAPVIREAVRRHPSCCFLVVGDMESTSQYRRNSAAFMHEIRTLGLEANVRTPGLLSETRPLYAASDICLNLSDHEGMSNVLMEAMSLGIPVLATDAGGARELIPDDSAGRVVTKGREETASQALVELLGDAALRRRIGAAGRARIQDAFGVGRMTAAYARLYRELS